MDRFNGIELDSRGGHGSLFIGLSRTPALDDTWPGTVLMKQRAVGRALSYSQALEVSQNVTAYYDRLAVAGWLLPRLSSVRPVRCDQEYQVWIVEEYIAGDNLADLWLSPRLSLDHKFSIVEKLIDLVTSIKESRSWSLQVGGHTLPLLEVGVDVKPANVVINLAGDPVLVDVFPPLNVASTGIEPYLPSLYDFGKIKLAAVCATRVGVLLRLWWLTRSITPTELCDSLNNHFVAYIGNSGMPSQDAEIIFTEASTGFPLLRRLYGETDRDGT